MATVAEKQKQRKKKKKGKGKGKGKARQPAEAEAAPMFLPPAVVKWLAPFTEGQSRVYLVPDLYGRIDKKDGWIVMDTPKEGTEEPMELNLEEKMHWNVVKAEMLCPKM